jgi:hypothetical protein
MTPTGGTERASARRGQQGGFPQKLHPTGLGIAFLCSPRSPR